jgi:hypothetical protein
MAFLIPAILGALAALAIPIAVHLRFREKNKPFRFPSLMFLSRIPIRTAQRRRVTDWPLLLVRAAILALLVFAFARPFIPQSADAAAGAQSRAVVVLVDRSLSMSAPTVWPAALDSARTLIRSLGTTDRVAVVFFDELAEIAHDWTTDHAAALATLDNAKPSTRGTRYGAALRTARGLLAEAGQAQLEAVLVTDVQRSGVAGVAGLELPAGLAVRSIVVTPPSRPNTSVAHVDVRRLPGPPRATLTVQARVVTRELAAPRTLKATLLLNGRETATRSVTVPATGELVVAFEPVPAPVGRVTGQVQLESDALPADDVFHFALSRDDGVRVLLVGPSEGTTAETMFFERALAIGESPAIRLTRVRAAEVNARLLSDAALVVLWDVNPSTGSLATALTPWVAAGGGVVTVVGTRLGARVESSPLLPVAGRALTERTPASPGLLGEVTLDHPLFAPFRDASAALSAVRFTRYAALQAAEGASVLARFDDGQPAVVEVRSGVGRVVAVATPLDARGSDFALQPAFLPFVRRLVLHTSGYADSPLWRPTGDSWSLRASIKTPVVTSPSEAIERPVPDSAGSAVVLTEAGLYSVYDGQVAGEPLDVSAVNAPANESDLTPVDPRELLLGIREVDAATAGFAAPPTPQELEGRQGVWRWLLALVAVLLIVETLMATRGWRAVTGRVAAPPPDRSTL